ncbi:MAG: D-glycero-beta-D-manno-heptose-7-phosphate kinase [candidate division Zixibacteria bacterium]|nr:D-glycero-beta-D-manno-heptose-7-phosphate kinase [candidate division Zixibacteria bacterium]
MKVNAAPLDRTASGPAHLGIERLLERFAGRPIVVLGDVMLDEYWWGSVERISPEAPVPIVAVDAKEAKLGGAANVAQNIRSLGGQVTTIGLIGDDQAGERVRAQFVRQGLDTSGLQVDHTRPTTVKTRIVAHHQQVVRADFEATGEAAPETTETLVVACRAALEAGAAGLVISDYGKGVITRSLLEAIIGAARERGKFIVVDPKDTHFSAYRRVTLLTPNHHEAGFVAGRKIRDETTLRAVGFDLLSQLEADSLLITRGEKGMALFEADGRMTSIPTVARHVYDVTGAGDTVVAAIAMCLAAGGNMLQAAYTANVAAGEVIKEVGTAQTTPGAIREALAEIPEPQLTFQQR